MIDKIKGLLRSERGIETIEVVIILVIIVAIGFAFRFILVDWYNHLIQEADDKVNSGGGEVIHGQH